MCEQTTIRSQKKILFSQSCFILPNEEIVYSDWNIIEEFSKNGIFVEVRRCDHDVIMETFVLTDGEAKHTYKHLGCGGFDWKYIREGIKRFDTALEVHPAAPGRTSVDA